MKVKGSDEAKFCIRKRNAFRWMGCRGMKSKTAEGCYAVYHRWKGLRSAFTETRLWAVYEPKTATWYIKDGALLEMHGCRLDVPDDAKRVYVKPSFRLAEVYRLGYPFLAAARIAGHL